MPKFSIVLVNYIGGKDYSDPYNMKVMYRNSEGKSFLSYVYVDFFNRHVTFCTKKQFNEVTLLKCFAEWFTAYAEEINYNFIVPAENN